MGCILNKQEECDCNKCVCDPCKCDPCNCNEKIKKCQRCNNDMSNKEFIEYYGHCDNCRN